MTIKTLKQVFPPFRASPRNAMKFVFVLLSDCQRAPLAEVFLSLFLLSIVTRHKCIFMHYAREKGEEEAGKVSS
jgi:hypothetical protein